MEPSLYGDSSYKICLLNQSDVPKKLVRSNGILTKFIYFCEGNFDITRSILYIYIYRLFGKSLIIDINVKSKVVFSISK